MKKTINSSEIILWALMLMPFIYLATIWDSLPETIATHFNGSGEADGWGSKETLIWGPLVMLALSYGVFLLIPSIDPKQKIGAMGKKFEAVKWIVVLLMVAVSILWMYSSLNGFSSINMLFVVFGIFFTLMGNFMPTIKHNYFVGIRTPWTLENETVWKKTHRMAGGWWLAGGIVIVLASLLLSNEWVLPVFITVTVVIALVPMVYSYLEYKKQASTASH